VNDPKISVVMATYERPEALEASLRSLCFWPSVEDCEVVITDDNSPHVDLIEKVVDKFWNKVRITFIKANAAKRNLPWFYQEVFPDGGHYNSATYAYNVSVRNSVAPLIMYCGCDLIHLQDNIAAALGGYRKTRDPEEWEDLVLIGTEYASTVEAGERVYKLGWDDPTIFASDCFGKRLVHPKRPRPLLHIGCVSRELLFKVGGMNEMLCGGFAYSDEDLGIRLGNAGGHLVWTKEMLCLHPHHERPDCLYGRKTDQKGVVSFPYYRNRNIVQLVKAGKIVDANALTGNDWGKLSNGGERRSWRSG